MAHNYPVPEYTGIDYKYICGRDNYTCQICLTSLPDSDGPGKFYFVKKVNPLGEERPSNLVLSCFDCLEKEATSPISFFTGRLIVITGPMYSAKSTTTQSLYQKYTTFNKNSIWIKPDLDDRKKSFTTTHNKGEIPADTVSSLRPDLHLKELLAYSVVAIDEIQFFNERILHVIHKLLENRTLVIVNGLKLTALRNSFGVMPYLLTEADDIISLKAICNICGCVDYATRTKSFNLNTPSVSTGGADKYFAVCAACDGGFHESEFLKKSLQEKRG